MSKIKNDGGKAFPGEVESGMSLRDYFAAKIMQSFVMKADSAYWLLDETKLETIWKNADRMVEWRDK